MRLKWNIEVSGTSREVGEDTGSQGEVQNSPSCICRRAASHGHIRRHHNSPKVFGQHGVANLLRFSVPIRYDNPFHAHLLNQSGNGSAPALVWVLVQAEARQKISTDHENGEALGSVDDATITLRFKRLVMPPNS